VSWRAVFFINVPIAAAILILCAWHVPESRSDQLPGQLDWPGALFATLGLGGLVYGLIEAPLTGWGDPVILVVIALGLVALGVFIRIEARHPAPILPLGLFRSTTFSGANVLTFFLYAALGGGLFFVPLNLIQVQGYSATAAGAALLPFILLVFLLSRWAGGLINDYGKRLPLIVGPILAGCAYLLFAIPSVGGSYWITFFPPAVVLGLGMAISVAPLTTTVMSAVPSDQAGTASGINNAASRVAALLAVALFGAVMTPVFGAALDASLVALELADPLVATIVEQRDQLAAIELPTGVDAVGQAIARDAINGAFVNGFRWVMVVAALLCFASAAVASLTIVDDRPAPAVS